jgi:hypothetical protein
MWLYLIVVTLVIIGIVGGIFAGGIFTIVLLPVALIVLLSGFGYSLMARPQRRRRARLTPTIRCRTSRGPRKRTCARRPSAWLTRAGCTSSRRRARLRGVGIFRRCFA